MEVAEEGEENMTVHIANKEAVEAKLSAIRGDGAGELHVVSDFDRTLTHAYFEDGGHHSIIALLRSGDYLTPDYAERAWALYNKYRPLETDSSIPLAEKQEKMSGWWEEHLHLMIECGMNKSVVDDIVRRRCIRFREGTLELLDVLHEKSIPILIFSAAIGDMISGSLREEGRLYGNVHVISNSYEYDGDGKVLGYENDVVHTFNKSESLLKGTPYEEIYASRKNVLLLGDTLGDLGMASGEAHDTLLFVGFLNDNEERELPSFEKAYDVVITGDGPMEWVLEAVKSV